MIQTIFQAVVDSLMWIASKTGLTYNVINILLYYLIIPLTWTLMLDYWIRRPYATAILACLWIGIFIVTRHTFRDWCDRAFKVSVDFLNWFNQLGGNYVLNSVIICVILPIIIYGILLWLMLS